MNTPTLITIFIGISVVVIGVLYAIKQDRIINLRSDRLNEKRIVIFEKNKRK